MALESAEDLVDQQFMALALIQAERAYDAHEVPVGAVLVVNGEVIGEGWNQPIGLCDPTAHAEVVALRDAAKRSKNYRIPDSTLYVTIEPCTMCVGALMHARVGRVVFGAPEPKAGVLVSQLDLTQQGFWNHTMTVTGGVLASQASHLMQQFFQARRARKKALKQDNGST